MSTINHNSHSRYPKNFPAQWASAYGEDEYGLWMTLTLKKGNSQQTFRWIEAGEFMMGENQNHVILTQGYWLAETACTQALWQAVMDHNPASFKESLTNPVEMVSWKDIQDFLSGLNRLVPRLGACLPTEAQWEYACRAGTTTAFSFGENISTDQVNYNGNFPYNNGEKGQYREKTVITGSLPPNPWGLDEMHGNVWEWCNDWYGKSSSSTVTDPAGPNKGSGRVLRGGSWNDFGRGVRSASRDWNAPARRSRHIGFRLALGQPAIILQDK